MIYVENDPKSKVRDLKSRPIPENGDTKSKAQKLLNRTASFQSSVPGTNTSVVDGKSLYRLFDLPRAEPGHAGQCIHQKRRRFRRLIVKIEEVSGATAVRRAKSGDDNARAGLVEEKLRPVTFEVPVLGHPHHHRTHPGAHVIDVPAANRATTQMASHARGQPSRPPGTADVNVES